MVPARLWLPSQLLGSARITPCWRVAPSRRLVAPKSVVTVLAFVLAAATLFLPCRGMLFAAPPEGPLFPPGGQPGQTVAATVAGQFSLWPPQVWVDRPGATVAPGADKGQFSVSISPEALPGVYWVRLADADGSAAPQPFVVGLAGAAVEQEPNDDFRAPQTLPPGASVVHGRLGKGNDVDVFAVSVAQGATLVASVDANRTFASPLDAVVQIVGQGGAVLSQNDDYRGLDPLAVYQVPAAGTYLVRVFGFPVSPDTNIGFTGGDADVYRLTISSGPYALYAWPLACRPNAGAPVELFGWNLPPGLKNLAPRVVGEESAAVFDLGLANVLELPLESHAVLTETEPNSAETPQQVEFPATIAGRCGAHRDIDAYRFSAKKGEAWSFRADSRSLGFPADLVLELKNAAGESLARVDDTGESPDAALTAGIPADGEYQVIVSELYGHFGDDYLYLLRGVSGPPDFKLTLDNHAYAAPAGQAVEIGVAIERKFGFGEEIEFVVEGLPADVEVAAQKSLPGDGTAAAVKLKLTPKAGGFSGPMRVIGQGLGERKPRHAADILLPSRGRRLHDAWFTAR